jgi:uncharacterized membrane protein YfcA
MNVLYHVELSQAERGELTTMLSKGKRAARKLKRAQILLALEVVFPFESAQIIPHGIAIHFSSGFTLGIGIGLVNTILGVAGGELLIPSMMFIFGADVKTAGSASIVISICVVASGLLQ